MFRSKENLRLTAAAAAALACGILLFVPLMQAHRLRKTRLLSETPLTELAAVQNQADDSAAAAAEPAFTVPVLPEGSYLLRLHDDRLCVYRDGSREAVAVYDLPHGWLPDYDRILLEYGMRVSDAGELRVLLEDYLS